MRRYTGIFSFPVPIEEDYVAEKCGITVPQLRQLLYNIALEHTIIYIPGDRADVLSLHSEHLAEGNVKLSPDRYAMLKATWHKSLPEKTHHACRAEDDNDRCRDRCRDLQLGQ